jgi:hypothetical protein
MLFSGQKFKVFFQTVKYSQPRKVVSANVYAFNKITNKDAKNENKEKVASLHQTNHFLMYVRFTFGRRVDGKHWLFVDDGHRQGAPLISTMDDIGGFRNEIINNGEYK